MRSILSGLALSGLLLATNCTMEDETAEELPADLETDPAAAEEAIDPSLPEPELAMPGTLPEQDPAQADEIVQQLPEDPREALTREMESAETPSGFDRDQNVPATVGPNTAGPEDDSSLPSDSVLVAEDPAVGQDSVTQSEGPSAVEASDEASPELTLGTLAPKDNAIATSASGVGLYIVQPGDTLSGISVLLYGSPRHWRELASLNNLDSRGIIYPGDRLQYAPKQGTAAFDQGFESLTRSSLTVQSGETLSQIAERVMGDARYWKVLWRWNEATLPDPNRIQPGQTLSYVSAQSLGEFFSRRKSEALSH